MKRWAVLGVAGCMAVAGCSDGGSDGDSFPPEPSSFADHLDEADAIFEDRFGLDYSDPASLPTQGSATYTGQLGVFSDGANDLTSSGALVADLQVTADFEDDAISAQATNFVTGNDVQLDGTVAFDDGLVFRDADVETEFTFGGATAEGSLTTPGGESFQVVDGYFDGDFYGSDEGFVAGEAGLLFENDDTGVLTGMDGGFETVRD